MVFPWPPQVMFDAEADSEELPLDPEDPVRFQSIDNYFRGLSKEFHMYLKKPVLSKLAVEYPPFKKEVKQGRTALVSNMRKCATLIMEGLNVTPLAWLKDNHALRAESRVLQELLAFPGQDVLDEKQIFSPIHYRGGVRDPTKLFMNDYQPKIIRALLFGKQSLVNPRSFSYGTKLTGMLWNVKHVNDACIAFSAVILRFIISQDCEFTPRGKETKINYLSNFIGYRRFLIEMRASAPRFYSQLHTFYNQYIFHGMPGASVPGSNSSMVAPKPSSMEAVDPMTETLRAISLADSQIADSQTALSSASVIQHALAVADSGHGGDLLTDLGQGVLQPSSHPAQAIQPHQERGLGEDEQKGSAPHPAPSQPISANLAEIGPAVGDVEAQNLKGRGTGMPARGGHKGRGRRGRRGSRIQGSTAAASGEPPASLEGAVDVPLLRTTRRTAVNKS
ncbi:hypothetical protein D9757_013486 [Collybiopsis confluens]|uniref:Uncharacterized protein n=1 Tax=Collybiopsis confluens TaxID=2823264 RepID=A0A8H5FRD5_9AGAR|nr:hypothetical protein D9757_013486 [Collybiopsis confluens]